MPSCFSHVWLCDPMDCSPPGSSVHGTLQARILAWVAMRSSRASSRPRDWTWVSCTAGKLFTVWASREAQLLTTRLSYYGFNVNFVNWHIQTLLFSVSLLCHSYTFQNKLARFSAPLSLSLSVSLSLTQTYNCWTKVATKRKTVQAHIEKKLSLHVCTLM